MGIVEWIVAICLGIFIVISFAVVFIVVFVPVKTNKRGQARRATDSDTFLGESQE